MRYSPQRQAVYDAVKSTDCHPSAEWVYRQVKKKIPDISAGTVYRNLKQLVEKGYLVTVETEDKRLHYDGNVSPHIHLVCEKCGKIYDIMADAGLIELAKKNNFVLQKEKVVLYGICGKCV